MGWQDGIPVQPAWMSGTPVQPPANADPNAGTLPPDQQRGMVSGLAHSALGGVPVLGPLAERGINKLYPENEQLQSDFEQRHPIASTAASVGGGIASMLPLGWTEIGAGLLGLTGGLPGMIAKGAVSGAGIGAADALARGQDPERGAAYGGLGGAAGPLLGRAATTLAEPVTSTLRGILRPADEANRVVAGTLNYDTRAGQQGLTRGQFNATPAARVIDLGGNRTLNTARSAANISPEGQGIMDQTIGDRFTGQSDRLVDYMNQTQNYPNAAAQERAIRETARGVNDARYTRAYQTADQNFPGGIWDQTPEMQRLITSPDVRQSVQNAASQMPGRAVAAGGGGFNPTMSFENGMLRFSRNGGVPQFPDLEMWDLAYRDLRDRGGAMFRQGLNTQGGSLRDQSVALRNALDELVPEYGEARSGAAHFNEASNALEAGQNFARDARPDVDGARQALADMTDTERQLFQDGYSSQIIDSARNSGNRRNWIATLNNTPGKIDAMDLALGAQRSAQLQAFLHVESIMDRARGAIQGNSTTARQLFQIGLAGSASSYMEGSNPFSDPASFLHGALIMGALRSGKAAINERVARQVAGLLMSRDLGRVDRGMQLVSRNSNLLGAIRNADAALGGIATRATAGTIAARQQSLPAQ